jgi:hypothetical protein
MGNGGQAAPTRPVLTRRIKVGIGATVVTLVVLFFPGQMVLPLAVLTPFMPRTSGCFNFGAGIVALAFFGLSFLISLALIGLGIAAAVALLVRKRIGLVGAVLVNAVAMSLMLMTPLEFSPSVDPGIFGLYALFTVCALIPAAALVSLLSPSVFDPWWRSRRPFIATAVAAGLLLLPGVAGTVVLGFQIASTFASQPTANSSASPHTPC